MAKEWDQYYPWYTDASNQEERDQWALPVGVILLVLPVAVLLQ